MTGPAIEAIEYYLPEQAVDAEALAREHGFDLAFVRDKLGVKQLFFSAPDEHVADLAAAAARRLFGARPDARDAIGVLAVCTQTAERQLPHASALVHAALGLGPHVACFDLSLGCSGFVYGLSVLRSFMRDNGIAHGLLITADTYSKITAPDDRSTRALFSDAACATLLGPGDGLVPLRFTFGTDGRRADFLMVDAPGPDGRGAGRLTMNGRGIFEFAADEIPRDIARCLAANGLTLADIGTVVFHQASRFMIQTLAAKCGLAGDSRVISRMEQFGNTVSSSIPIAMKAVSALDSAAGHRFLVSGFGVGLSWASAVLETRKASS